MMLKHKIMAILHMVLVTLVSDGVSPLSSALTRNVANKLLVDHFELEYISYIS